MTFEQAKKSALFLEDSIPLLAKHEPPGFRDFRSGVPPDFRSGIFVRADHEFSEQVSFSPDAKAKFGSEADAKEAAAALALRGITSELIHPHSETLSCDGNDFRVLNQFWTVRFTLPEEP